MFYLLSDRLSLKAFFIVLFPTISLVPQCLIHSRCLVSIYWTSEFTRYTILKIQWKISSPGVSQPHVSLPRGHCCFMSVHSGTLSCVHSFFPSFYTNVLHSIFLFPVYILKIILNLVHKHVSYSILWLIAEIWWTVGGWTLYSVGYLSLLDKWL